MQLYGIIMQRKNLYKYQQIQSVKYVCFMLRKQIIMYFLQPIDKAYTLIYIYQFTSKKICTLTDF